MNNTHSSSSLSPRVFAMIVAAALLVSALATLLLTGTSGGTLLRWLKGQQKGGSAFDLWHGQPAPDLTIDAWTGTPTTLCQLRGRPVVLAFWASWSPPSRDLLAVLNRWAAARPEVAIFGIAAEDPPAARAYADPMHLTVPLASIADAPPPPFDQIIALPTTFFINADGLIVHVEGGPLDPGLLERVLGPRPDA